VRRLVDGAALAIAFLTIVPIRLRPGGAAGGIVAAAASFPAVGALVGALAGGVLVAVEPLLGQSVASLCAIAALVAITGALHQDGLADCADGLGVRGDRDRRLAVMRDSAIGVFGAMALLLWTLLMASSLAGLSSGDALRALVAAGALGRWATLLHAVLTPPARADGLGATFDVSRPALVAATATAALVVGLLFQEPIEAAATSAAAGAAALLVTGWARATLGGRTGDTLGACVAVAELSVCLTVLGTLGR
jgi:adenosylcobinamide-GDP ribazoletransferase